MHQIGFQHNNLRYGGQLNFQKLVHAKNNTHTLHLNNGMLQFRKQYDPNDYFRSDYNYGNRQSKQVQTNMNRKYNPNLFRLVSKEEKGQKLNGKEINDWYQKSIVDNQPEQKIKKPIKVEFKEKQLTTLDRKNILAWMARSHRKKKLTEKEWVYVKEEMEWLSKLERTNGVDKLQTSTAKNLHNQPIEGKINFKDKFLQQYGDLPEKKQNAIATSILKDRKPEKKGVKGVFNKWMKNCPSKGKPGIIKRMISKITTILNKK